MISKADRFPLRQKPEVFRKNTPWRGVYFDAYLQKSTAPKAAVVIGKFVSPKAASRNHLKRQLLDIVRDGLGNRGVDIVLRVKRAALGKSFSVLKNSFDSLKIGGAGAR